MPTRIPTFYFTTNRMYGHPDLPGVVQPSPMFRQGEDVRLQVQLLVDGRPLSLADYGLTFLAKKSVSATNTMIRQPIVSIAVNGVCQVVIPARTTAGMRPGLYYFAFEAVKHGTGEVHQVMEGQFDLELGVLSPNPTVVEGELTADGDSVAADSRRHPPELTVPRTPEVMHGPGSAVRFF